MARVRTTKPARESSDWTIEALRERKWDVTGVIIEHSNSHGLIYKVRHDDGSTAWYEPRELHFV